MCRVGVLFIYLFFLSGCFGHLSDITKPIGKAEVKDVRAIVTLGKKFNKNWPAISGYMTGALGVKKGLLPHEALNAWAELDYLAGIKPGENKVEVTMGESAADNDYEFAYAAGARARLLWPLILETLKAIAPDVFQVVRGLL